VRLGQPPGAGCNDPEPVRYIPIRHRKGIKSVTDWVRDLNDGKGPVCSRHQERLDSHEKAIEDHVRRITTLEQRGRRF
jgi:hypothetical protein